MKVYVVFREYQADTPEIIGVYTSEARANKVRRAEVQEHLNDGVLVEQWADDDPDDFENGDNFEDAEWQVDINVEAIELDE